MSQDKKENIEREEHLDSILNELSGYKLNSEMRKDWIVPPAEDGGKIKIKFVLPSELVSDSQSDDGGDVFWGCLNYPDGKR